MNIIDDLKLQYRTGGITLKMIFWNIGIFLISLIFYQFKFQIFAFPDWISLSSNYSLALRYPWTLLSYAFFHSGFWHLVFNMLVLNFAGRLFLTYFTAKQFLGLYLLSAIFAGIMFVLAAFFIPLGTGIVGASAAIMAILVATTTYQPLMNVRLFLFGNVKLWYITAVIILLDLMQILVENTGGHIAHLSGAFFGFVYIRLLQNGTDLSKGITSVLNFFSNIFRPGKKTVPFKKIHKNYNPQPTKTVSKIVTKDRNQQQIDEILDKISRSGYDSLTKQEKEFLFKVGK